MRNGKKENPLTFEKNWLAKFRHPSERGNEVAWKRAKRIAAEVKNKNFMPYFVGYGTVLWAYAILTVLRGTALFLKILKKHTATVKKIRSTKTRNRSCLKYR